MVTEGADKRIKNMTAISNLEEIGFYCLFCKYYGGIEAHKKISYQETGRRTYLDIFREKGNEKRPLFIYIHGGGWLSGLRTSRQFYCKHYAKKGFVSASIGYDYGVDASHPTHLRQIFKGIEYILDNAGKYGIDTENIVIAGESAGGYFTSMVGAVSSHKELYNKLGIDFRYRDTFKVSACVIISGIFDLVGGIESNF